jgi:hypothetical protein
MRPRYRRRATLHVVYRDSDPRVTSKLRSAGEGDGAWASFAAPHAPYQAPQEYLDRYAHIDDPARRAYAAMITAIDDEIGRVLHATTPSSCFRATTVAPLGEVHWRGGHVNEHHSRRQRPLPRRQGHAVRGRHASRGARKLAGPHQTGLRRGAADPYRHDDDVADVQGADVRADGFNDADSLVAHAVPDLAVLQRPVRPKIAAADAGAADGDDRVGGIDEVWRRGHSRPERHRRDT